MAHRRGRAGRWCAVTTPIETVTPHDGARATDAIVHAAGLTKRFKVRRSWRDMLASPRGGAYTTVVDRVSFEVYPGEIFGLLGQNGAGKTTIFRMLTTLVLPDAGTARIAGRDVLTQPDHVRGVLAPAIANERSLNWRLSAHENVRLYSALQGLAGRAARDEERRVLRVVGLDDTGEKLVGEFSSGMRQRLLIARALLAKPRVLLLDEPTRSLDPISARDFRAFLRETIVGEQRCTVLLATHDADDVWELCDRVGVLDKGRLLDVDATAVLRNRAAIPRFCASIRRADSDEAVRRAHDAGLVPHRRSVSAESGWDEIEFEIAGGADEAARVLRVLSNGNAAVSRFERVAPTLAELIERVVAGAARKPADA